jgi:hypothetical protein
MHALVFDVTIKDRTQGEQFLKERIVPGVSQLPGFVAGYSVNIDESHGMSLVVFRVRGGRAKRDGGRPAATRGGGDDQQGAAGRGRRARLTRCPDLVQRMPSRWRSPRLFGAGPPDAMTRADAFA